MAESNGSREYEMEDMQKEFKKIIKSAHKAGDGTKWKLLRDRAAKSTRYHAYLIMELMLELRNTARRKGVNIKFNCA